MKRSSRVGSVRKRLEVCEEEKDVSTRFLMSDNEREVVLFCENLQYTYVHAVYGSEGRRSLLTVGLLWVLVHSIPLHYITLHYITVHYITLHYITLHYITFHYIRTCLLRI